MNATQLKFNNEVVVKYGNTVVPATGKDEHVNYTVTQNVKHGEETDTFDVSFTNVKDLKDTDGNAIKVAAGGTFTVDFTAELLSGAVIGEPGNPNESRLEYSNNPNGEGTGHTPWDKVVVFTFKVVANKKDDKQQDLDGAHFKLEKWDASLKNGKGDWKPVGQEITTGHKFEFSHVDSGHYRLTETKAPDGYNKVAPLEFFIKATYDTDSINPQLTGLKVVDKNGTELTDWTAATVGGTVSTDVVNKQGSTLPETGGMGTTILYVAGAVLVIAAGVWFGLRRKAFAAARRH